MNLNVPNALKRLTAEDKIANHPYRVGALFTLQKPTQDVPKPGYPTSWVVNQAIAEGGNDECGGVSSAFVSGLQEGKQLDPHFHWMMARMRGNMSISDYGCSNRDLAMTLVKVGSLLKEDSPLDFKDGRDKIATPTFWDVAGLLKKAIYQKKGSVVWVKADQGMDAFDYFRASVLRLNKLYGKPHGAVFGLTWAYGNEYVLEDIHEKGAGHDVAAIATEGDYVIIVNSYGLDMGKDGEQKVSRKVFNRWAEEYGCFIPIDATQDEIKWAVENGTKLDGNWLLNILVSFSNALKDLLAQLKGKAGSRPPFLWDTPEHCRYNVRVICDQEGLTVEEKNIICACIYQESGFNNNAVCRNRNKDGSISSSDWGIVQVNDYWHVGKGKTFPSAEYIVEHPEEAVRWMIECYKHKQLGLWVSYSSGAYKKWLSVESKPGIPY